MITERQIREALQDQASRHVVNPRLPRATVTKARVARLTTMAGVGVAAVAVAIGGVTVVNALDDARPQTQPGSGEPTGTDTRRTAPLLLITAEGWTVQRADEYGVKEGEVTFRNGNEEIGLYWRPAKTHDYYLEDRAANGPQLESMTVAGQEAVVFQTEGTTAFNAMWLDGPLSLELRGGAESEEAFRELASTLAFVDEETWLAAMPGNTIKSDQRAAVVDEMLTDIPVHPKVDIEKLKTQHTVSDRYQLGAQVTGAVTCAWIEQWVEAKKNGNADKQREAEGAMEGSPEWNILIEMESQGGWSEVVWDYADAMNGDNNLAPAGAKLTVEEGYRDAFGCTN